MKNFFPFLQGKCHCTQQLVDLNCCDSLQTCWPLPIWNLDRTYQQALCTHNTSTAARTLPQARMTLVAAVLQCLMTTMQTWTAVLVRIVRCFPQMWKAASAVRPYLLQTCWRSHCACPAGQGGPRLRPFRIEHTCSHGLSLGTHAIRQGLHDCATMCVTYMPIASLLVHATLHQTTEGRRSNINKVLIDARLACRYGVESRIMATLKAKASSAADSHKDEQHCSPCKLACLDV